MATIPLKPCASPGCPGVTRARYCERHARTAPRAARKAYDGNRPSAAERGYDAEWQRWRAWFLRRHPLCHDCSPRVVPAVEVHHRKKISEAPELRMDEDNCLALCRPCHNRRTAQGE